MSYEFEQYLDKYVDVILKVGLNLQKGQRLLIGVVNPINAGTPVELAPFVRKIVKKAYQMGAKFVEVMWNDPQITLTRLENAPKESFEEFPIWRINAAVDYANNDDAIFAIAAQDPKLFFGQDPKLLMTLNQAISTNFMPLLELIVKNVSNWCLVTAPIDGWAESIFPDMPTNERDRKLWDTIFEICRIKQKDPVSAWKNHINNLKTRCEYLNQKQYDSLKIIGPETDLTVGLVKDHIWIGGSSTSQNGIEFVPNLPTDEIFTTPDKNRTEGKVRGTKPLYEAGTIIENFSFTFSKGKVIEVNASKGKEMLEHMLKYDEGARYLGEIALVPISSPISQTGLLFYNTLIDENASIHLALGTAYKFNVKNGDKMSDEEFEKVGGNTSILHMDFMIGSEKINIDGVLKDGVVEPIMKNGEWAFEVTPK
ncbi:MAG: aminopeptidase [Candidatus Hermodarchaeota archaeon]